MFFRTRGMYLEKDRPLTFEAWDVEFFRHRDLECIPKGELVASASGKAFQSLTFRYKLPESTIEQHIILRAGSRRLDFETNVDWHERRKMLRVAFNTTIRSDMATFDIQYGFIKRPTHTNTSWDMAKFEVCGQRYADLSSEDYGVALLNDCKYGYHVEDSSIELTLLRSPTHPHFDADQGQHIFTYSLLPHNGDMNNGNVIHEASNLNRMPSVFEGMEANVRPFARLDCPNATLEVIKKAEKEDAHILRITETLGREACATLDIPYAKRLIYTNLVEWEKGAEIPILNGHASIPLKPFEIVTVIAY